VTNELPTWPEASERERRWVRSQGAAGHVTDPGLARVLSAAAAYLAVERPAATEVVPPSGPYGPPKPPARRALSPVRLGLLLAVAVGAMALAATTLMSRQGDRRGDGDGRAVVRAAPGTVVETDGRGGDTAGGAAAVAPAPGDSTCRVQEGAVALTRSLSEASGIAPGRRDPGVLWTHNDSGEPVLYAFAPDGRPLGQVRVTGARVQDWEDVAAGPCAGGNCLYVADIGDNKASRASATVYRVPEPAPADGQTRPAEAFHATYPDGPHDAEALFVLPDGGIYIVTKGETGPITIYHFPQPLRAGATVRLERVVEIRAGEVKRRERITGASASPDGRWVALRTLDSVDLYRAADLLRGTVGTPVRVDLRSLAEAQGEGVGWGPSGTVYLSSEGGKKNTPGTLARLSCTPR
jgi:hypothetical protein